MRFITSTSVFLALASAFLLYGLNYDTRQLEARVQQEELAVAQARSDIAVLKAERAHLTRPERIEPLADPSQSPEPQPPSTKSACGCGRSRLRARSAWRFLPSAASWCGLRR
jgi:cell division protein FtsL